MQGQLRRRSKAPVLDDEDNDERKERREAKQLTTVEAVLLALSIVVVLSVVWWCIARVQVKKVVGLDPTMEEKQRWNTASCRWRDPPAVLFLRLPKAASTTVVNLLTELAASTRRFRMHSLPEWPFGVGVSKHKYGCQGDTIVRCPSKAARNFAAATKHTVEHLAKARERVLVSGHVFHVRGLADVAAIVATAREPTQRLASGYHYENFKRTADPYAMSLGECALNHSCTRHRDLGRLCSLHALYFCGFDDICAVDEDTRIATDATVDRALANINTTLLTVVPVDDLDTSGFRLLAKLLPTYFDGIDAITLPAPKRSYDSRAERRSHHATNGHHSIGDDILEQNAVIALCRQDIIVFDAIKQRFLDHLASCSF